MKQTFPKALLHTKRNMPGALPLSLRLPPCFAPYGAGEATARKASMTRAAVRTSLAWNKGHQPSPWTSSSRSVRASGSQAELDEFENSGGGEALKCVFRPTVTGRFGTS
jgi:hypothetical protein